MSHELRTPLNSLLILAKLLADNPDGNLNGRQVEFAQTIHSAGTDLLQLINDILDLSKVEAGKMDVHPADVAVSGIVEYVEATFRPLTAEKDLRFSVVGVRGRAAGPWSRTSTGSSRCCATCCRTRSSSPRPARSRWRSARSADEQVHDAGR